MNYQQLKDLAAVLERAGERGIRLVYRNLDGDAFFIAYEPAETPEEAGELPMDCFHNPSLGVPDYEAEAGRAEPPLTGEGLAESLLER